MSTRSTQSRRGRVPARVLTGTLLAGLALSLSSAPTTAIAAPVASTQVAQAASGTADVVAPAARAQKPQKAKKRRFGPLRLGVSTGFSILYADDARRQKDLARTKALGVQQIRLDISWAIIQPERDIIDWSRTDTIFREARAKGLTVLAVIGFAPEWAEFSDGSVKPDLFRDFVDAAARRYGPKVAVWEIWNEPNQARSWIANPDPAAYARVVEAGSAPIRRHDPKAKILMGALAPAVDDPGGIEISPISFLKGVYAANIKRSAYDAVSIHPSSYPALASGNEEWNTFNRLPDIYQVLKNNGDGKKPMWLTEYGARTGTTDRSISYQRHKRMMVDAYRETKKLPFVQALYFYSLRDASPDLREDEDNFGLLKFNGQPKPAYKALRREIRRD